MAQPLSQHEHRLAALAASPKAAAELCPDAVRRSRLELARDAAFDQDLGEDHPLWPTLPVGEGFLEVLTAETGGRDRPISASAVDTLASCLFRGFASDVLRLRWPREVHDVRDIRETGLLVHLALEEAFRATASLWSERPRDAQRIIELGMEAADGVLARQRAPSNLARLALDAARQGVQRVLEWSIADEAWDFAHTEVAFGEEGSWPAHVIEAGGTRVAIRGRIDRVDVAHHAPAVRVVDYKTRERAAEAHTAALGITKFQVALYARLAMRAMGRVESEGMYLAVEGLRVGGRPKRHAERWSEATEATDGVPRFEKRIAHLVSLLRTGHVGVRPYEASSCKHCDFDGVCRKPRFVPTAPDPESSDGDDG